MLRIRIGQRWKHERASEALDAFGVELDGVALVPDASEEPLVWVMEQVLASTVALTAGQRMAQVSLPESAQELLLVREGDQLGLRVLRVGRPAGEVRPRISLELEAWRRAVVRTAKGWIDDLRSAPVPAHVRQRARMLLAQADREPVPHALPEPGWGLRLEPRTTPGFRLEATDGQDLLGLDQRRAAVPVAVLVLPGRLLLIAAGVPRWEHPGPVGLLALELLRQGEDLVRALETGERSLTLLPAGLAPPWEVDLAQGAVVAPAWRLAWPAAELARALIAPALTLGTLLPAVDPLLGQNPYLLDFVTRGQAAVAALRALVARPRAEPRPARRPRASKPPLPLQPGAEVRRLGFLRRGRAPALSDEGVASLHALDASFVLVDRTHAVVVTPEGTVRRRWRAQRGVALGAGGEALLAGDARWLSARLDEAEAHWFRDHDGAAIDGHLLVTDALLLVTTTGGGVRAVDRLTGRERWRFLPQRPQRLHLGSHGARILVASESGSLHGLDAAQGTVRFRIPTPLPCLGPPVPWGRAVVAVLGRSDRMAVLAADPHAGTARWVRELPLASAAPPLARGASVRVLGQRDGAPVLVSLGPRGATRWQRPLPLGPGPWTLVADGDASLAAAGDGSAVRVDAQGRLDWRLGGQKGHATGGALLRRGVLLVPGGTVRAVGVDSGRVVAEIPAEGGLAALAATEALDVAVLDAAGDLTLWQLGASLGVVAR